MFFVSYKYTDGNVLILPERYAQLQGMVLKGSSKLNINKYY